MTQARHERLSGALLGCWLSLVACASSAQTRPGWQALNEEIRSLRETRDVALSPDGKSVLATLSDSTAAGGHRHLWLLDTAGGLPRQLTFGVERGAGERQAQWSPDGSAVFFISKRVGVERVYRLPMGGGEPLELSLSRDGGGKLHARWSSAAAENSAGAVLAVEVMRVAPDGQHLAIGARDPASKPPRPQDDAVQVDSEIRQRKFYVVGAATDSDPTEVELADSVADMRWNPRGDQLAVITSADDDDLAGPGAKVWWVKPFGGATRSLIENAPDTVRRLEWSPDGRRLAYLGRCQSDTPPDCNDIYVQTVGEAGVRDLTRSIVGSVSGELAFDQHGRILTTVRVGLRERIACIDPETSQVAWLDGPDPVTQSIATNARRDAWVLVESSSRHPPAPYLLPHLEGRAFPLEVPALLPGTWKPVGGLPLTWRNGSQTIEGLLYLPVAARSGRVPLIVHVHGGPSYLFQDRFYPLVNLLVERGWAVLQANPRGSLGYGAPFLAANRGDLGGADYRDIMSGVAAALQHFPIDPQRLALVGYSYGGTMAAFAAGQTDRFKALVSGAPVIDQFSEYGTEDSSWYDRWYLGQPWRRFEAAWRQSPLSGVGMIRSPLLFFQGMSDVTDPPGQTLEIYRALRQRGASVELVQYPREDHIELHHNFFGEPSIEPWHGVDLRRRMIEFIENAFAGANSSPSQRRKP